MQKELKCPKCGSTCIIDDCYDVIHGENNTIKELCCGHCENCNTDIQWEVVYQFIGYTPIEES